MVPSVLTYPNPTTQFSLNIPKRIASTKPIPIINVKVPIGVPHLDTFENLVEINPSLEELKAILEKAFKQAIDIPTMLVNPAIIAKIASSFKYLFANSIKGFELLLRAEALLENP